MKLEGLILDESDITQQTKTNRNSGESQLVGSINLITTAPTDTIKVSIPAELWDNGKAGEVLKRFVGNRTIFNIEYRDMAFGNEKGQHVSINGFQLHSLPAVNVK